MPNFRTTMEAFSKMGSVLALCLAFVGPHRPALVSGFAPIGEVSHASSYLLFSNSPAGAEKRTCRPWSRRNDFLPPCSLLQALSSDDSSSVTPSECPGFVTSEVLRQVYPDLMENIAEYGHPNIPLGTTAGKQCKTLRRLAFQNKLAAEEVELLDGMGFRWSPLEDVYEEADFDDCLSRLVEYERVHQTGYQIPKKCREDPELGAWVTMIRRIGREGIEDGRRERLDNIGFAWVSTRKCGSSFMTNYRQVRDAIASSDIDAVRQNEDMIKWLGAQSEAADKGNLSSDRIEFLDKLSSDLDWRNL